MIEIRELSKKYPGMKNPVLDHLSLSLPKVGLIYFIGKSGSGKSTLLHLLGGMDDTYQGSILYEGKELKTMSEDEKARYRFEKVSFAFQSYYAQDKESVRMNLLKALAITKLNSKEKEERIQKRLRQVNLLDKEKALYKNLSGGEKKRISLARALLKDTPLLLADEPLSSLNEDLRKNITNLLEEESKQRLVIIITHEKGEIPPDAKVYELQDGHLNLVKEGKDINSSSPTKFETRKPFQGKDFFLQLIDKLRSKRQFLFMTIFTLMIALFSITLSFQLSFSVSASMQASLSSYMDENSFVISNRDLSYHDTRFQTADYQQLLYLKNKYSEDIIDTSTFYTTSFDALFNENQSLEIFYQNKILPLPKLSLNSFLEYRMIEEIGEKKIYGDNNIALDEVIIALDEERLVGLYLLLFQQRIDHITTTHLKLLENALKGIRLPLRIKANQNEWGYHQDYSFRIKGVVLDETCYLIHPSSIFSTNFVTQIMHFKEVLHEEGIPPEYPWTLKKSEGLRLKGDRIESFLKSFLFDPNSQEYTLSLFKTNNYYKDNDLKTHNHIIVLKDYLPKIHLSDLTSYIKEREKSIESICYSSPIYTYTSSGYISGFSRPCFFSKYKEKLNQIQDNAMYAIENLGSFQGSLIEDIDGVIKADLISSMDSKTALKFHSLEKEERQPFYGKKPESISEIAISKKMAIDLYHSATASLNATLNILLLKETTKYNNRYINHFIESEVKIVGVYDDNTYGIYHESLFPLIYCFINGGVRQEDFRIDQVVLKVDLDSKTKNTYLEEIVDYGNFSGSFPMYDIIAEIEKTLKFLSLLFLGFAMFSLFAATSLLILSLYLILRKERKDIGILLFLGYTKKEVTNFYFIFTECIGLISYILSMFFSIITEQILQRTLGDLLNSYQFSLLPYLISLTICILISSTIGFILSRKCRRLTPKSAFENAFR